MCVLDNIRVSIETKESNIKAYKKEQTTLHLKHVMVLRGCKTWIKQTACINRQNVTEENDSEDVFRGLKTQWC